jgi:hypothetical protein
LLTRTLRRLFRTTFEEGLHDPILRPSCADWATALWQAVDATLACQSCAGHRFATRTCPWCGAAPAPTLVCRVWLHAGPDIFSLERAERASDPSRVIGARGWSIPAGEVVAVDRDRPFILNSRHGEIRSDDPYRPLIEVRWDGGTRVQVTNVWTRPVLLISGDRQVERRLPPGRDAEIEVRREVPPWRLCFTGDLLSPHRQVTFDVVGPTGMVR